MLRSLQWQDVAALFRGALWTIALCACSGAIGTIAGLLLALGATSGLRAARWVATVYVSIVRGIPLLVIIFFAYFGIPLAFPAVQLAPFVTAAIALCVFAAAYMAEVFRGSIEAVDPGQREAADALGLGYWQTQFRVILPQALRIAIPPGIGFLISLVKDSSLVTVMGFVELTTAGSIISNLTAEPIRTYLLVAAYYFVICYVMSRLSRYLEKKLTPAIRTGRAKAAPHALDLEGV